MPQCSFRALIVAVPFVFGLSVSHAQETRDAAEFLQSYRWRLNEPSFGGFSAIELDETGNRFVTLSDRATVWSGRINRDAAGAISSVFTEDMAVLRDGRGKPLNKAIGDSEGLAVAEDGGLYISFEGRARVSSYATPESPERMLPRVMGFKSLPKNGSLEALAIGPDGALYTLPEDAIAGRSDSPVWRFSGARWSQPFGIPRDGAWKPVGADFGPDGRFYLLERDLRGLAGFATRVRVFDISGDRISAGEVVLETPPGRHGDLEGIAVWRDAAGAIRLTMIADDNFSTFLSTEIVEYRLPH